MRNGKAAVFMDVVSRRLLAVFAVLLLLPAAFALGTGGVARADSGIGGSDGGRVVVAFVYDDSGSMFGDTAWCQAKYGLETIAGMLDESDKLKVFPLNSENIEVSSATSQDRIDSVFEKDIVNVNSGGTPGDKVADAAEWLLENCDVSAGDAGYLIVATDGGFNSGESAVESGIETCLDNDLEVYHLKIGTGATDLPVKISSENVFSASSKPEASNSIFAEMTEMSERVFGWTELKTSGNASSLSEISLPVSAKRIIVVAQGDDAQIGSLEGASEEAAEVKCPQVPSVLQSSSDAYSVDESLVGAMKIFTPADGSAFETGSYSLSAQGISVKAYYDPNVELQVDLSPVKGFSSASYPAVGNTSSLPPGEYKVKFSLHDLGNGKDVTDEFSFKASDTVLTLSNGGDKDTVADGDQVKLVPGTYTSFAKIVLDGAFSPQSRTGRFTVKEDDLCIGVDSNGVEATVGDAGELAFTATVYDGTEVGKGAVLSGEGVQVKVEDSQRYFEWNEAVYDEASESYLLTMRRKDFLVSRLIHDIFGYKGSATVYAQVDTDDKAGTASKTFAYELKPDPEAALFDAIVLLLVLLIVLHFIGRGRLGRFEPYFVGPPGGNFSTTRGEGTSIGEMLFLNRYRRIYRSNSMGNATSKSLGVARNLPIELSGVCFSFGGKARFENWTEWKQDGWRLSGLKSAKGAKGAKKPIVTAKTALVRDGSPVRIKFTRKRVKRTGRRR